MKNHYGNGCTRNARFWVFCNDGWVRLTLQPGQCLAWRTYSRDCEGWASTADSWEHTGDAVLNCWHLEGRDCDGRCEQSGELVCGLDDLRAIDMDRDLPPRPDWQPVAPVRIRDFSAELANY